ncbi:MULTISPECIES: L-threonylcarbamoyladenylate synthase [unclassified Phycicoccus]|uniref:L-threonylcarbamoyladenylate synthase n=1 Tax=unclassified Phycicoccus TaxID=2637926 RepID=UPI0009E732CC|nr:MULTISPECIES: L-threonylcarbamoyladenylate synthase [unclassified Phycicoccus]
MSPVYDCTTESGRAEGIAAAVEVVRDGGVVVLPTDTVYGIGADAFSPEAVASVLAAKGRGREMPPPVLVPSIRTVDGLATDIPSWARDLIREFWPGPLTLVFKSQSSLMWDLGDTNGTVAVRMPQDETALALLSEVGPMAVTSANLTGQPPATTATDAAAQLGAAVAVYLDAGPTSSNEVSTIIDCTGAEPEMLRAGAITQQQIDAALRPAEPEDADADNDADAENVVEADAEATPVAVDEPQPLRVPEPLSDPEPGDAPEPARDPGPATDPSPTEPTQGLELPADPTAERTAADHPGETR